MQAQRTSEHRTATARPVSARQRAGFIGSVATALVVMSAAAAPSAHADPNPLPPNEVTCGITTCTAYWSVDRTNELQAEWKDTIANIGDVATAGGAVGGVGAFVGTGAAAAAGAVTAVVGAVIAVRTLEFEHMINGAANDGRCLIYKFPRPAPGNGWFGSVSTSNKNCD